MAERTLSEMMDNLRQTQQTFLEILTQVNSAVLYRRNGDDWTLAEDLAHIAEARGFWSGEVRKVRAMPGATMGRTLDDPGRLQNIKDHGNDTLDMIRGWLISSHEQMLNTLNALSDADLQLKGAHVRFGEQTIGWLIERFMVEHDQAHVQQAQALLNAQ